MATDIEGTALIASGASEIRSSSVTAMLASSIPDWMDLPSLDASFPHGYGLDLPRGQGDAIAAAAATHEAALMPAAPEAAQRVLRGLRVATILQREDVSEADATLKMLRVHLADVPLDILEAGCRAYCNAPGKRYFPKSAGELRSFTNPLVHERQARAFRLRRLAEEARRIDAEREALEADPLTPETAAAIIREFGIGRAEPHAKVRRPASEPRAEPTVADYLELGLSEEDARAAMAERARILARTPASAVGGVAGAIVEQAGATAQTGMDQAEAA